MLFLNCAFLLLCATDWTQAKPELVWLEDLNSDQHLRHLEMGLPNYLEFNLKRQGGNKMKLRLQENKRLNANAPMYEAVMEDGKQKARELDVPPIIGTKFYQDKRAGAAVKVSCTNQPYGACQRVLEGSLHIEGDSYEIKPSPTILTARDMGSQKEVPHLIVKVEPPPKPKSGDRVRGLYGAHSKRIPDDVKNEASDHDHKAIPGDGPVLDEPDVRGVPDHDHKPIPEELPEPNIRQELVDELRSLLREEEVEDKVEDILIEKKRSKRAAGDLYAVEVVIVIDPALWKKYLSITNPNNNMDKNTATEYFLRERLAHIMNGVSLRYEEIEDSAMNVYVTISEFLFYKKKASNNPLSPSVDIPVVNGIEYADSDIYIDGLPGWAKNAPITKHDDHIMVITGYELYYGGSTANDGVAGVAFVSGACGSYRTSVQEDGDYFVLTSVAAHELGHNLGADHDGSGSSSGCNKKDKYIMAPFITTFRRGEAYNPNPWRFSSCSIQAFKKYFGSGRCFLDKGDYYDEWEEHNKLLPGERFSADEQCRLIKGQNSYACSINDRLQDICRTMACYDSGNGNCYFYAAARGTSCGDSMWCINGKCVERTEIVTTTQAPRTTTTTTEVPRTTTEVPRTTTTSSCEDIGWYDWSCQEISEYFYETYFYEPSYWCEYPFWDKACCVFCKDAEGEPSSTTSTTMSTTATTESCVDRGYYNWSCKRVSKYFKKKYSLKPKDWCTDPEWKYNCCDYCAARGV